MIEVDHLHKVYGSTVALKDVSFRAEPGEILGFLGPNGAGKTTTMRILTGYLPATSGTAKVANYDVHTESMAVRQHIGYLPERPPLYPDMTVEGFLNFVGRIKGVAAGDRPERISHSIRRCGLDEKRSVLIRKLSKGFRQRVGIAQAIVHDPDVIVLDEPTSGLDPRQNSEVRELVRSLAGDHTIILSTHILPEVDATCDRVAIINKGHLVAAGKLNTLMSQLTGTSSYGYSVEVRGAPANVQGTLKAIPGVNSVELETSKSQKDSRYQFIVTATRKDHGEAIAAAIVQAGFGLCELRRHRVSLEDVFLNLTTEESIDESAAESETPTESRVEGSGEPAATDA
ncbi:ABC transporter ATP-binding protein [Oscillatoria sp. CS-180]|uniref:ABC transporter ATP-binding protein n=1 Tax=Oscillatoria sp. CS-180 TaxID=3021720 RepID=UPI00232AF9ED|nr:ABC transporter ATP-binding protein [Oscillatoria sp. CS-180]MDB9527436.1 ABC transporter ATP-binding protein [Oscillatoria sp. CS-180]